MVITRAELAYVAVPRVAKVKCVKMVQKSDLHDLTHTT